MSPARVALARGGTSFEREVSLRGARRVGDALREAGHHVEEVEIDHTVVEALRRLAPDFVFVVAHGRDGEDGGLQGLLELLRIPYTGSDSLASALCIDKVMTKRLLLRAGLPTPEFQPFTRRTFERLGAAGTFSDLTEEIGLPLIVKPSRTGSSFGIKLVSAVEQLRPAILGAVAYDEEILVERHVTGPEFAVTVMGAGAGLRALPPVEIRKSRELYDYEAHYDFNVATLGPADVEEDVRRRLEDVSVQAARTMGCRDFARVDLILEGTQPQILEINTIPGLTETGPTPFAADLAGMSFNDLVSAITERVAGGATSG